MPCNEILKKRQAKQEILQLMETKFTKRDKVKLKNFGKSKIKKQFYTTKRENVFSFLILLHFIRNYSADRYINI